MTTIQALEEELRAYLEPTDLLRIQKAYHFAEKAHEGQTRRSGHPYIVHPVEVATILVQMRLDAASIVAALLHDTLEDTSVAFETLEVEFGREVAFLVEGVTKLGKIHFSRSEQKQAENFRKMLMAMAQDIRVILIKLADRLSNLRSLAALPEEKRLRIARETQEIYAPLANRLGIQWMKIELEDLAFSHLKPEAYQEIQTKMARNAPQSKSYIEKVITLVSPKLDVFHISHEIYGRLKHYFSIYRKMQAQEIAFEQVHDLLAFRVIVENIQQCYAALGILHEMWTPVPGRFKDYIAMPKANQYRSLHTTVICLEGQRAEFQIRTHQMHEIAEKGIAAHWKYKEGPTGDAAGQAKFGWVQELLQWQTELKDPAEFLDTIKLDLFANDVYVFTPKGELKELPYGSTPIDFAYAIHSDVGHHCVGARVNERLVPLNSRLKSGDTVEILTSAQHHPSKDWLKFVTTSKAKSKIRFFIRHEQREKSIKIGIEILEKEFENLGLNPASYLKGASFQQALSELGVKSLEGLAMGIGYGKLSTTQALQKLVPKEKLKALEKPETSEETVLSKIFKKAKEKRRNQVRIAGYEDIMVSFGRCCAPLPGDPILGFITRGRGVTVHHADCQKVLETDPERQIDVVWETSANTLHLARLKVVSADRPGLLASMTKIISNQGINISQASIRTTSDQKAVNLFEIEVKSASQMQELIRTLEQMPGILDVERLRE